MTIARAGIEQTTTVYILNNFPIPMQLLPVLIIVW